MTTLYVFGKNGSRYAGILTQRANAYVTWRDAANALYAKLGQGWTVVSAEVL